MKNFLVFIAALGFIFSGCSGATYPDAEFPFDAAREFIDGCLKGDFKRAEAYMLVDVKNDSLFRMQEKNYAAKTKDEKQNYNEANIIIIEDATIDNSTHIINYQNSYDKVGRKVKVILVNDKWLVDFKYTFDGNL